MPTNPLTSADRGPLAARSTPRDPLKHIDSRAILGQGSLVVIEHGTDRYFLRMTRNNKLILTK